MYDIAASHERLKRRIALQGRREPAETIPADPVRRSRSLRTCHLPAEPKPRHPAPRDTDAYVPEMSSRLDNDRNITDGAKVCARKITEYVYLRNREGRSAEITVSYLAKALGRCRRTVQRYLRQLEREGYLDVRVVPSERTRMCFGLLIRILDPLLPRHRRSKWPQNAINPDVTNASQIYLARFKRRPMERAAWAALCCDGVWRSYMKTISPVPAFS
jgi:hypothetical protein